MTPLCIPQVDSPPRLTQAGFDCIEWFNRYLGGSWARAASAAIASGFIAEDLGEVPVSAPQARRENTNRETDRPLKQERLL